MFNIWLGRNFKAFFAAYFFLYSLACIASNAYATSSIVSHNANYTLSMGKKNSNASVQDVAGKISFTLNAQCDGWSLIEDYFSGFYMKQEKR